MQQTIQIEGVPLHVIDTAGLRDSDDEVERIGIARAWEEIAGADAVLFLHDLSRMQEADYRAADAQIAATLRAQLPRNVPVMQVWNKADALSNATARQISDEASKTVVINDSHAQADAAPLILSAKTGDGLDVLRQQLLTMAGWQSAAEGTYIARARHVQALQQVQEHLDNANDQLHVDSPVLDLLAEELRLAQQSLSAITGEFTSDDLLGVIFSSFCIGK